MARYRKLPVVIEAVQFTGSNHVEIAEFMGLVNFDPNSRGIPIDTKEGTMVASPGWWVIKGVKGEFYPCDPEIFEQTYETA